MENRPIVIITLSYLIGILLGLYFKINIALLIFLMIVILVVVLIVNSKYGQNKKNWIKSNKFLICFYLVTVILSYANIKNSEYGYDYVRNSVVGEREFKGKIMSVEKESNYFYNYVLQVNDNQINKSYRFLLKIKKVKNQNNIFKCGDYIAGIGKFSKPEVQRNYKGFDYSTYLKTKSISVICQVDMDKTKIQKSSLCFEINACIMNLRYKLKTNLLRVLPKEKADIASALLLGYSNDMDENQRDMYSKANVIHVLAISGMHVNYIVVALSVIQKKLDNRKGKIILIIFLLFFVQLTGSSPSVVRAAIMCVLAISSRLFYRKSDTINNVAIACLVILIFNPYNIYNIGFQLSFLGTFGIVLLNDKLKRFLEAFFKINKNGRNVVFSKVLRSVISIFSVSISANIFIMPILVYNYNMISFNFLITSILIAPILGMMLLCGYITIIISLFSIGISKFFSLPFEFILNVFKKISEICSSIDFSRFKIATPSIITIIIYYVFVIFFIFPVKKIKKCKRFIIKLIAVCTIVVCVTEIIIPINIELKINFVDVGQGDCTLIVTNTNKKVLIDGGGSEAYDVGKNVLLPYLYDRKINYLDYIIVSHFDTDHVGGLLTVMKELKVGTVVISKQGKWSQNYQNFMEIVKDKKIKVLLVDQGDRINIDRNLYFDILWPKSENLINDNILNNNSIVCKLYYNNFSMLFTGDIEEIAEKQIVQEYKNNYKVLNSTVLKVGHHGSKTSSTQEFLNMVRPKIALIGVGKDNKFGHPNDDVINRLENLRCSYL